MARRYSLDSDAEGDGSEADALILHRLTTDASGKAHITSLPSNDVAADERATDRFVDSLSRTPADDAEMALPRRDMPALEKSGRPTWLADLLLALRRSARLRLMLLLLVAALVIGAFAAAFAPAGVKGKMYSWGTERWHGKARPYDWDQQVGYAGITKTGAPAGLAQTHAGGSPTRGSAAIETRLPALKETGFRPFEHMGPLSPYVAASDFGVDNTKHRDLPAGCAVSKVHILHRHGSRYPTTGAAPEALRAFHASSASSSSSSSSSAARFSGPLAFLNTWRYKLGAELLVPLGRAQLVESGVKSAVEYGTLMALDTAPPSSSSSSSAAGKEGAQQPQQKMLVRAGSQHRIVESATSWLVGVWGAAWREKVHLEVQIEAEGFNTTLAPNFACPAAGREGSEPGAQWVHTWVDEYLAPATRRLNAYISSGAKLTPWLVYAMQQTCSYETVAFGHSDFCALFEADEWRGYEYAWDLTFYGSYGPGSPIGRAQGVGWVNEFLARLTATPWNAATQTSENSTLASDAATFPLDRAVYADFTHDSVIAGVLAALSLPNFARPLPISAPDVRRAYKTSQLVPFAARLVFEDVSCASSSDDDAAPQQDNQRFVRMLLNDAVVQLAQLPECAPRREDGMCAYAHFLASQERRMERAQWQRCF